MACTDFAPRLSFEAWRSRCPGFFVGSGVKGKSAGLFLVVGAHAYSPGDHAIPGKHHFDLVLLSRDTAPHCVHGNRDPGTLEFFLVAFSGATPARRGGGDRGGAA